MQALYEAEHGNTAILDAIEHVLEEKNISTDSREFIKYLAEGSWDNKEIADSVIKKYSKGWRVERIGGVDRNILRLAIFEINEKETPFQIVINEALELAKEFSTIEASKFINGILGAYIKDAELKK
ncbi:transcription antitermination factor NusB [Candidatus Saganbacteria bacterium]|nr:transcription antitermination factor NusB [Candidatus Saganbacteria bacterium]